MGQESGVVPGFLVPGILRSSSLVREAIRSEAVDARPAKSTRPQRRDFPRSLSSPQAVPRSRLVLIQAISVLPVAVQRIAPDRLLRLANLHRRQVSYRMWSEIPPYNPREQEALQSAAIGRFEQLQLGQPLQVETKRQHRGVTRSSRVRNREYNRISGQQDPSPCRPQ